MFGNIIRKIVKDELNMRVEETIQLNKDVSLLKETVDSIDSTIVTINKQFDTHYARMNDIKKEIYKAETDIRNSLKDIPEETRRYIDNYVDISIRQVISQGMKCSTKISHKEESFEEKIIAAQGKIKRQVPIINERLRLLEDRISELENKTK